MLELAALGLLRREPLHGYRLKQQLELFMGSCISVNYGAIYPLLKRLEHQGAIAVSEASDAGCSRKIYRITHRGRELLRQQMMEHPQESWVNARSRFMIKLFFFNHLQSVERLQLINQRLKTCQLRLESVQNREIEELCSDQYQASVLNHHLVVLHSEIIFLKELLKQELNPSYQSNTHTKPISDTNLLQN
jgi:DNA-binding PadR family transcriptional regulator